MLATSDLISTVIPAVSVDLTVKETVKEELAITSTEYDARIDTWIVQASNLITGFLGRELASAKMAETWRLNGSRFSGRSIDALAARLFPVTTVDSVVENGITLTGSQYEIDGESGLLYRLESDVRVNWPAVKVVVTYRGGYVMLEDLPYPIERACIDMVKIRYFTARRDPLVRTRSVVDVGSTEYRTGAMAGLNDGIPEEVISALAPYREVRL